MWKLATCRDNLPLGRVVQILGSDAETASDVDLSVASTTSPLLSARVLEAAAGLPSQLSKTDLKQRLDLRSLLTLTLEAEGPDSSLIENAFTLENQSRTLAAGHFHVAQHPPEDHGLPG